MTKYPNQRKGQSFFLSEDLCMALTESNPDPEAEVEWVRELRKGDKWLVAYKCDRIGNGKRYCKYGE